VAVLTPPSAFPPTTFWSCQRISDRLTLGASWRDHDRGGYVLTHGQASYGLRPRPRNQSRSGRHHRDRQGGERQPALPKGHGFGRVGDGHIEQRSRRLAAAVIVGQYERTRTGRGRDQGPRNCGAHSRAGFSHGRGEYPKRDRTSFRDACRGRHRRVPIQHVPYFAAPSNHCASRPSCPPPRFTRTERWSRLVVL
jgi:hypothetical protein